MDNTSTGRCECAQRRGANRLSGGEDAVNILVPRTRNFDASTERLTFEKGFGSTVRVGDLVVGRLVLERGYRWSEHMRPLVGTDSCDFHHTGVALAGVARYRMDDGTEFDVRAGDVFEIPPGHDSWVLGDERAVSIVWSGWRGYGTPQLRDRVLLTILMTDVVGSTDLASSVGDAAWGQLLERHNTRVRDVLELYRGTEIGTTGDGFLATFDGAARAVRAAIDVRSAVRQLGLEIRAGVHTGEVELMPAQIHGVAVHEAARIMALARPGEILVSGTTREFAVASGLGYEDRGMHRLRGVSGARQLFAVSDSQG